ncbi:purine-cytosine permease fcy22 [Diplodia corticola]|uniref:Purine-cytosine permease fcy22 n=1 Tax=Diplodia corticola TaxID=236234 RepID=A0A1J9RIK9_9PEZI|nr:purine-cytosine permease fcy22 [Diplodia corticola]OJD32395.1 purine-cytosine permease fcy22 [Diplodia corticola]
MSPPTPTPAAVPVRTRKKPGPKPRPLEQRAFALRKPVTRVERSYSKAKKIEVLMFLQHHRVLRTVNQDFLYRSMREPAKDPYRRPTFAEASRWFKISNRTIENWWKARDTIAPNLTDTVHHAVVGEASATVTNCEATSAKG